jgi:DNA-binding CsgD family transcriptional regulator
MSSTDPTSAGEAVVVGRERELETIERFLESAERGFRALALSGDPGIGKTTLLGEAARRAEDRSWCVLSARAAQAEVRLSYVAVSDLLAPVADTRFAMLPPPLRQALDVALLRADPAGPLDQRAAATGVLSVLAGLAAESPVLVAIDDAQWLDRASASALEFAARRLRAGPVAFAFTRLGGDDDQVALERACRDSLVRIPVGPLSLGALNNLIKVRLGEALPRRLIVLVERLCGGNPLFALELAEALLREPDVGGEVPELPSTLAQGVRGRVVRLPRETREALLLASMAGEPTVDMVDAAALEPAREAGIVRVAHGGAIVFDNPLLAWASREAASPAERRVAHERLAGAVQSVEERAGHLALAAEGPSEELAADLEQAAAFSRGRGAPAAASVLLGHAMRLTPEAADDAWARRCAAGISVLAEAGDWEQAGALVGEAMQRLPPGVPRAAVLLEAAHARPGTTDLCLQVIAEADGDPMLTTRAELLLGQQALYAFDVPSALRYMTTAIVGARQVGNPMLLMIALTYRGVTQVIGGGEDARTDLEEAIETLSMLPGSPLPVGYEPTTWAATYDAFNDELARARGPLAAQLRRAEEAGDEISRAQLLGFLHQIDAQEGDWESARSLIEQGVETADLMGYPVAQGLLRQWLGRLQAQQGELDRAAATLAEARGMAEAIGDCMTLVGAQAAQTFLALSLEDYEAALGHAGEVRRILPPGWDPPLWLMFETDEIEALVALGRQDEAAELIVSLERRAGERGQPRLRCWAGRGRALLLASGGDLDGALDALADALEAHRELPVPFELARTLLLKGKVERRAKHKAAARDALEQAIDLFDGLGAPVWAGKARAEHARLGLRRSREELTETERRVAELAGSGKKNREIAAELFMSVRTVETNLARAYRKLGVKSRAELGAAMAARAAAG